MITTCQAGAAKVYISKIVCAWVCRMAVQTYLTRVHKRWMQGKMNNMVASCQGNMMMHRGRGRRAAAFKVVPGHKLRKSGSSLPQHTTLVRKHMTMACLLTCCTDRFTGRCSICLLQQYNGT